MSSIHPSIHGTGCCCLLCSHRGRGRCVPACGAGRSPTVRPGRDTACTPRLRPLAPLHLAIRWTAGTGISGLVLRHTGDCSWTITCNHRCARAADSCCKTVALRWKC
jgi:hypothetical protein